MFELEFIRSVIMKPSTCRTMVIVLELVSILILSIIVVYQYMSDSFVQYAPVVELKHGGKVRGLIVDADERGQVFMYEAIPFGTAERFKKGVAHEGWSGTWDATYSREACPFLGIEKPNKHYTTDRYSEDCLFATVWVPSTPEPNEARPVMVYIYGGAFLFGTVFKESHDARYIAARGDVIVVGFNYRLGALGFLHADDDDAPGNVGLWDQVLALEWVQANIHLFGGDPNRVTTFGNSAGSQSIAILLHSPVQSNRLFHRAIFQSGGSMITQTKHEAKTNTYQLAQNMSCPIIDTKQMLDCLRQQSVVDILTVSKDLNLKFLPMYGDKLFPVLYADAVKSKSTNFDVDIMFGLVQDEGTGFVLNYFPQLYPEQANFTLEETIKGIPVILNAFKIDNAFIVQDAIDYYTSNLNAETVTPIQLRDVLARIRGEIEIDCPEILMVERWARHAPMKRYYSFRVTQRPLREANICSKDWMGVCHADELFYLFMIPEQVREIDRKLSQVMIRAWTLFARFGNPQHASTVFWDEAFTRKSPNEAITKFKTKFMKLEHNNYEMIKGFYTSCEQFWYSRLQY